MNEIPIEIIKDAADNKKRAFKKLYDFYGPFVWKIVYRTVAGDADAASQIMQDVFIKVHRSLKHFHYTSAFSTWLYRITFNISMNYLNTRNRWWKRKKEYNDTCTGTEKSDSYENRELVNKILKGLDPYDRFLLITREIDGVSYEELESITGKSAGSLRTHFSRIRDTIRKGFDYEN